MIRMVEEDDMIETERGIGTVGQDRMIAGDLKMGGGGKMSLDEKGIHRVPRVIDKIDSMIETGRQRGIGTILMV